MSRPGQRPKARGNSSGSAYQRKSDGRWIATVSWMEDGQQRRIVKYAKPNTKSEANRVLTTLLAQKERGSFVDRPKGRTPAFKSVAEAYLEDRKADPRISERPLELALRQLELHVFPRIGGISIDKLRKVDVQKVLNGLSDPNRVPPEGKVSHGRGRRPSSKPMSGKTIAGIRNHIKQVLDWAIKEGNYSLARNVAKETSVGRISSKQKRSLTFEQVQRLLEASEHNEHRYAHLFALVVSTGLRINEALSLPLDAGKNGTLVVKGSLKRRLHGVDEPGETSHFIGVTKTEGSERTVLLLDHEMDILNRQRLQTKSEALRAGWRNEMNLLFLTSRGKPVDRTNTIRYLRNLLQSFGEEYAMPEDFTQHELRHTAGSVMHQLGIPAADIANRLGHKLISTTTDTYIHGTSESERRAVEKLNAFYGQRAQ